jgi:dienelactone hydrolase
MKKLLAVGALLAAMALPALAQNSVFTPAGAEGPAQTVHPPAQPGPIVILISGASGPNNYQTISGDVSRLGYYAVLLDGNDILTRQQDGAGNLRKAIERAQGAKLALPGKVAVIGFSLGGGGALAFASNMPEQVNMVVTYYPSTAFVKDAGVLVKRFRVPVLVLAGGRDTYRNCCLIESMRAMESAAKESGAKFELVVYADGQHGFNLDGPGYRRDYETDAWRRTVEMLKALHPLKAP